MNELITVEDVNSVLMNLTDDFIYELDTSEMTAGHSYQVDFITVAVVNATRNGTAVIRYTFDIPNSLKSGGYAILDKSGSNTPYSQQKGSNDELIIEIQATHQGLEKIKLLMSNYYVFGETEIDGMPSYYFPIPYDLTVKFLNKVFFTNAVERKYSFELEGAGVEQEDYALSLYKYVWSHELWEWILEEIKLTEYTIEQLGANKIRVTFLFTPVLYEKYANNVKLNHLNFNQVLVKQNNYIDIQADLKNGQLNKVDLNILEKKRMIIDEEEEERIVDKGRLILKGKYLDKKFTEYCKEDFINLDLRDKIDDTPLKLTLELSEGLYSNRYEKTFLLPCVYEAFSPEISEDLEDEHGTRIYKVYENQTFNGTYHIGHDTIIDGGGCIISSDEGVTFIINENVKVKIYNLNFENGNPLFIQKENSSLELVDCSFTDCLANDYEGLGSVIHCDVEIENLNEDDDFLTILRECSFTNCHGAILHGGELSVRDCSYVLSNPERMNGNAPQLLYQTDGAAILRGNDFDVTIDSNYFCENEINLKLAQCLFICGENATINYVNSKDLMNEESLSFFGNYSNQSHVFLKYYYPKLETCIYLSPVENREDKNLCYGITGLDYIFKYNVKVTRSSWGTENRINPINLLGGD